MTTAALPPLRLVIFDATDTRRRTLPARTPDGAASISPGLTPIWRAGAFLHCVARAADDRLAASSWGWDPREGVRFEAGEATAALWSSADAPNTLSCMSIRLPEGL